MKNLSKQFSIFFLPSLYYFFPLFFIHPCIQVPLGGKSKFVTSGKFLKFLVYVSLHFFIGTLVLIQYAENSIIIL